MDKQNSPLPAAGLKDLLLFFLGKRKLFEVEGASMLPALAPKQRLLVKPLRRGMALPAVGAVVVCHHPSDANLVMTKRILSMDEQSLDLRGDNPDASTDSRHFGPVPLQCLIGEATAVVPLAPRRRLQA